MTKDNRWDYIIHQFNGRAYLSYLRDDTQSCVLQSENELLRPEDDYISVAVFDHVVRPFTGLGAMEKRDASIG